ncbi:MAG: hypothetical protein R2877_05925 [Bdellovibrionota bacterium]
MVKSNAYGHDLDIISEYCEKLRSGRAGRSQYVPKRWNSANLGYENRIISFGKLNPEILDAAHEFNITVVVHPT